jgi:hypothetical protein
MLAFKKCFNLKQLIQPDVRRKHLFCLYHTYQVTCFRRVTPGNRACHPHFSEHPSGHGFHYDDPESPGIGPDIRNIYLFIRKIPGFYLSKGQQSEWSTTINNTYIPSRQVISDD